MFRIFQPDEARESILKRVPLDEMPVPETVLKRTAELFGEPLSPAQAVDRILIDVRRRGDDALHEWSQRLDGSVANSFAVPSEELQTALQQLPDDLRSALELAASRIRQFHEAQPITSWMTQKMGGTVGQYMRPILRVGLYIPAGSAPLPSSVLMSAIPAQVAGVAEIVLVAPPNRQTGKINSTILASAAMLGLTEVYAIGGAQAVAAMAYGTQSIRPVKKIYGPGNLFVSLAKRQVFGFVGIDSIAGPTETIVIADDSANPEWVAADLLAQAEHDVLASAILLSPSKALIKAVRQEVEKQVKERNRNQIIAASMNNRSGAVLTRDLQEAVELSNEYGPEHLCLAVSDPWRLAEKISAAGGIFVGEHSFEVLGDYVAGPSHVMPTGGSAHFNSPLNVMDFVHVVSLIALDRETARQIAPAAVTIASAEQLDAHANSARVRL
ncbi:MAG: histidinol dehydrogenase [Anaerolineaceae bacterium]|nr:histidinol dehydrogenase [Anaerolineaceae bacterium]